MMKYIDSYLIGLYQIKGAICKDNEYGFEHEYLGSQEEEVMWKYKVAHEDKNAIR